MKTKHIHTHVDKNNHCIRVWLDPSVDIDEFEKKIHAACELLKVCLNIYKQDEKEDFLSDSNLRDLEKAIEKAT